MCGILLVVDRNGGVDRARFKAALDAVAHRGPDGTGIAHIELETRHGRRNVGMGHRRLSILDLSDGASQPFRRGRAALVYNGEIYNFRSLRSPLATTFTTDGDTEVLFELMQQQGLEGLAAALGMWSFCHLDEKSGRVIAARDRLGKKPLFYFADATTICFASEIGAITTYIRMKPSIEQSVVDTYLTYGWTLPGAGETTPINDIKQVLPSGYVTVDLATWMISTGTYATRDFGVSMDLPPIGNAAELLRDAVLDRLVSDRKVGLLLSGGIDSSLILSVLAKHGLKDHVHCFIGDTGKSEDAAYATRVTEVLGVTAETISLQYDGDSLDRYLSICRHQHKPFPSIGNVLGMPELYEHIAHRGVPVVLDGTGADEIFGGYWERYYRFAIAEAWEAGDEKWIAQSLEANGDHRRIDEIGRSTITALQAGIWPPRSTEGAVPTVEMTRLLAQFCADDVAMAAPADPLVSRMCSLRQALYCDITVGLLPEWLWQNDRNAMRSGVENRSPFLDMRLMAQLTTGYQAKFNGPWNKRELRQLFNAFRPAPTQWRREKQGFRWVFARFLRANRSRVIDLIASSSLLQMRMDTRPFVDAIVRDEELLFSDLTQRCLCLAGLEATTQLRLR